MLYQTIHILWVIFKRFSISFIFIFWANKPKPSYLKLLMEHVSKHTWLQFMQQIQYMNKKSWRNKLTKYEEKMLQNMPIKLLTNHLSLLPYNYNAYINRNSNSYFLHICKFSFVLLSPDVFRSSFSFISYFWLLQEKLLTSWANAFNFLQHRSLSFVWFYFYLETMA